MAKVTLEQKKLEMIKKQLYGKPQPTVTPIRAQNSNIKAPSFNNVSEVSYLYHDLKKIVLLGSLAVFIQLGLFFLVRINLVSLSY